MPFSSGLVEVFASHFAGVGAWAQQSKGGNQNTEEKPANYIIPQRHSWPENKSIKQLFHINHTNTVNISYHGCVIMFKPETVPVLGSIATKWPISTWIGLWGKLWAWNFHRSSGAYHGRGCRCPAFMTFKLWNEGCNCSLPEYYFIKIRYSKSLKQ